MDALEEGRIQVSSMVQMMVNPIDKYQYLDNETTSGRSVDQCGDQGVQLSQARNQTTAVVATAVVAADDEWLSLVVDVADVADEDDENVILTTMTTEDMIGWKVVW